MGQSIEVRKLGAAAGAEIHGVNLREPLHDEAMSIIHKALLDNLVIAIPDQPLNPDQLIEFGMRWGELFLHPNLEPSDIHPALIAVERRPGDIRYTGSEWHSDTTHIEAPPKLSIMQAKQLPAVGGDTLFANQYLAYENLSEKLKEVLGDLRAVHSDERVAGPIAGLNALRTNKTNESADWQPTQNLHPVVRIHPETGRKALYVNVAATLQFEDMTREESAPLLGYLFDQNHLPEYCYRQVWRENTIVVWDNRCLVHIAVNDCQNDHRLMHRLQIVGDRPH